MNSWRRVNTRPDESLSPADHARVHEMEEEIRRLRMENEFLKNVALDSTGQGNTACGLLRADARVAEGCALIKAEKANYSTVCMCGLVGVARSTFYA